jgi:lipoprotein-anchoring transpeptidase ErfK/SrfK
MARYSFPWRGRRLSLNINGIYIILALLIVVAILAVIYGRSPFGSNEEETVKILPEPNLEGEATQQPIATFAAEPKIEPNVTSLASKTTITTSTKVTELIAEAMALINDQPSAVVEARDRLNEALLICQDAKQQDFIKEQLSKLAERWLFSKSLFPNDRLCDRYRVKNGDQLRIIGLRHKVPYELLAQINNIANPQVLQAGQTIKVINGPFNVRVSRSTFTMDIYLQKTFVQSFPIGLGKPGKETPTGLWRVKKDGKMERPIWTDPDTQRVYKPTDPDYPLGSRWIELEGMEGPAKNRTGFGIHGTKDPETIGTAESRGCIRLHNGDAILVYNLLVPIYSLVRVED